MTPSRAPGRAPRLAVSVGFNIHSRDAPSLRSVWSDSRPVTAEESWLCWFWGAAAHMNLQLLYTHTHTHCRGVWLDLVCRRLRSVCSSSQQRPMLLLLMLLHFNRAEIWGARLVHQNYKAPGRLIMHRLSNPPKKTAKPVLPHAELHHITCDCLTGGDMHLNWLPSLQVAGEEGVSTGRNPAVHSASSNQVFYYPFVTSETE